MRQRLLYMFFGAWFIYLAFLPPGIYSIDGYSMLAVADSLVTRHDVTVPAGLGIPGKDGLIYSSWYPLQSVLAVPVVAVAIKASNVFHVPVHYAESFSVALLPALYTALTVPLVFQISTLLQSSGSGAWLAGITYGFGTMALVYTRDFYADPLLALLVTCGVVLAFMRSTPRIIIAVTALAVLAKPTGIILGPILSMYLLWKTRRYWLSLLPGLGSAIGLAAYFLYNLLRFGNPLTFGQPWKFSIGFIPQGIVGLLISPGAGLLWFCPCVVLCVVAFGQIKIRRMEAWTIVALAASSVILHSLWWGWTGGWSWGPRLLLPVLPGLVALTGVLRNRWQIVLAALAVLGFLLTVPNLISFYSRYYAEANEQGVPEADLLWLPTRSLLLNAWPAAYRQIQDARHSDVRQLLAERTDRPAATVSTSRSLRVVGIWWWVLPVLHIPRVWGILTSSLLAVSGIWLLLSARNKILGVMDPNCTSPPP
jgi:hypothetical protein